MVPGHVNHSDDELAFLSFYPLLGTRPTRRCSRCTSDSLERSWQIERPERNPLWNVIYAASTGAAEFDRRSVAADAAGDTDGSDQLDGQELEPPGCPASDPLPDRFHNRQSLIVLPYDELPMWKWNGNPYALDGGHGGTGEDDGAYFLLPYWMGRYHQLLPP